MSSMIKKGVLLCMILLALSEMAYSQGEDSEFQSWLDFTSFVFLSKKSAVGGDAGFRGLLSSTDWNQVFVRPTYRFQFKSLDLAGGLGWFYTGNKEISNVNEWRLFQQATLHWPSINLFKFNHRIRFEQRWLHYSDQKESSFFKRIRYQLSVRSKDFSLLSQKIYFKAAMEAFQRQNSGDERFVNTSRLILGVGHRPKGNWWYELHYIRQGSRSFKDDGFKTSEHILRIRLFRAAIFRHRIE